jgi:hypothetical protein
LDFNVENVKALAEGAYIPHARAAFGPAGLSGVTTLLNAVKLIYQRSTPEALKCTLTVVVGVTERSSPSHLITHLGPLSKVTSYTLVGDFLLAAPISHHAVVEVAPDGSFNLIALATDFDLHAIAQTAVVYRFENGAERIIAKQFHDFVPKVSPMLVSNFAVPTLASLEAALERYGRELALETQCRILAPVWEGGVDGPRLVLVNKPEWLMRDSLIQAIQLLTRDTSVRPEQNTDEKKTVDVRVEWFGSSASALIEVKWLGRSTAIPRKEKDGPSYTDYGTARAQEGAYQLTDYLDRESRHSNAQSPRGYLVVFDARRRNVKGPAEALSAEDALFYADSPVTYDPNYAATRTDFAPPYRFFMRPRQTHFVRNTKSGKT